MSAELLTERMREAARTIEEAAAEYHRRSPSGAWLARNWTASDLDQFADAWEAEDREAEEGKIEAFARDIREAFVTPFTSDRRVAERLAEMGYSKA